MSVTKAVMDVIVKGKTERVSTKISKIFLQNILLVCTTVGQYVHMKSISYVELLTQM